MGHPQSSYGEGGQVRVRWRKGLAQLAERALAFRDDEALFESVLRLLDETLHVVDASQSAGQVREAVAQRVQPLFAQLSELQQRARLSPSESLLLISALQLTLGRELHEPEPTSRPSSRRPATIPPPEEPRSTSTPQESTAGEPTNLSQAASLLGRAANVLLGTSAWSKSEPEPLNQLLNLEYGLLYERTRQLAITDQLTGLYNFGYFRDRLREERARADRYERLLSLIIIDIDCFKLYNDVNGHPSGNEVLRGVARILRHEARDVDIVARYGGEELVILAPEANRSRAFRLAERVRQRIAAEPFARCEAQPTGKLTISAGVATYPIDADTADELIDCADRSLYRAKGAGRDRVASFRPSAEVSLRYTPYRPVQRVALVGNFNNWDKTADPMATVGEGAFEFTIALRPGVYHYKYVLDGSEWVADPTAEQTPDPFGGENGVLTVPEAASPAT